MDGYSLVMTK